MEKNFTLVVGLFILLSCNSQPNQSTTIGSLTAKPYKASIQQHNSFDSSNKTIHVFVALCDNRYQGIVPVPPKIGNGKDLKNNLYWGCSFGISSYFKNSQQWKLLKRYSIDSIKLERLVFKHVNGTYFLVADAYNGQYIKQCTIDFLKSSSGQMKDTLQLGNTSIGLNGNASLLSYIGHDGLMDFTLDQSFNNVDNKKRSTIILACISKKYFARHIAETKAYPLLWSTGLMSPEAYTLHDALEAYIQNQPAENIRSAAAAAYSKYQHCSKKAASNLLVSGW